MTTTEFFTAIVAVIVAGTGSTIALAVYLSSRIDRFAERISEGDEKLAAAIAALGGRIDHQSDRIDHQSERIDHLAERGIAHEADREVHR